MSNSETIIKQLTDYLAAKDRKIADLEELVRQQSKTIVEYFTVPESVARCNEKDYVCWNCGNRHVSEMACPVAIQTSSVPYPGMQPQQSMTLQYPVQGSLPPLSPVNPPPTQEKIPITLVTLLIDGPVLPKVETRLVVLKEFIHIPTGCCRTVAHDLCIRLSDNAVVGSFKDHKFIESLTVEQTVFCNRLGLKVDIAEDRGDYGGCG